MILYDDLRGAGNGLYYYNLGSAPNLGNAPQISAVGTMRRQENVTITGINFGASAGQVMVGGLVQPVVSWGDTSIVIGPVSRGTMKYGPQNVVVTDSASVVSTPFVATLLPQTGWNYVNLVAPLATSGERLLASPDLANNDQVAYGNVTPSGTVTVYSDASFLADGNVGAFNFEVNDGSGWGTAQTQTLADVFEFTGALVALPAQIAGTFAGATDNLFSGAVTASPAQLSGTFASFMGTTFAGAFQAGLASMQGTFFVSGEATVAEPTVVIATESINPQAKVAIVNQALAMLGEPPIQSLLDNVKAARLASTLYDAILDQELARHCWKFAMVRKVIDETLSDEPIDPFQYQYGLPADWLTTVWIGALPTGELPEAVDYIPEWSHQGRFILTNETAPISLLYVRRVQDTTQWHALFAEVYAARLAMKMADSLTNSVTKWQKCRDEYDRALREARRMNAIMDPPRFVTSSDSWLTSRH